MLLGHQNIRSFFFCLKTARRRQLQKTHVDSILPFYIYALAAKTQSCHLELNAVQLLPYLFIIVGRDVWLGVGGSDYLFPYAQWEQQRFSSACVQSVHERWGGSRRGPRGLEGGELCTTLLQLHLHRQPRGCKSKSTPFHTLKKEKKGSRTVLTTVKGWLGGSLSSCFYENYNFHLSLPRKQTKNQRTSG